MRELISADGTTIADVVVGEGPAVIVVGGVEIPVTILCGEETFPFLTEASRRLAAAMPQAEYLVVRESKATDRSSAIQAASDAPAGRNVQDAVGAEDAGDAGDAAVTGSFNRIARGRVFHRGRNLRFDVGGGA